MADLTQWRHLDIDTGSVIGASSSGGSPPASAGDTGVDTIGGLVSWYF